MLLRERACILFSNISVWRIPNAQNGIFFPLLLAVDVIHHAWHHRADTGNKKIEVRFLERLVGHRSFASMSPFDLHATKQVFIPRSVFQDHEKTPFYDNFPFFDVK